MDKMRLLAENKELKRRDAFFVKEIDRLQEIEKLATHAGILKAQETHNQMMADKDAEVKRLQLERDDLQLRNDSQAVSLGTFMRTMKVQGAKIERLQGLCNSNETRANRFCSAVNEVAEVMGHTDKDHYAPDAVIRWVKQLQRERNHLAELLEEDWLRHNPSVPCPNFVHMAQSAIAIKEGRTTPIGELIKEVFGIGDPFIEVARFDARHRDTKAAEAEAAKAKEPG